MRFRSNKTRVNALMHEHEEYVRKLCTYRLRGLPDCVEDCVQEVFLELTDALNAGRTISYPKAWLTKVADNKAKKIYNQKRRDIQRLVQVDTEYCQDEYYEDMLEEPIIIGEAEIPFLREKVIKRLSEKEQKLLEDKYVLKKSVKELAEEQGTTENNIHQKLFRLRQKTRMIVKDVLNEHFAQK